MSRRVDLAAALDAEGPFAYNSAVLPGGADLPVPPRWQGNLAPPGMRLGDASGRGAA